jgi:hypothetical protein
MWSDNYLAACGMRREIAGQTRRDDGLTAADD